MISIDSCKLRIPTYKIEIKDPSLLGNVKQYTADVTTGEILSEEEFKKEAFEYSEEGITVRAIIEKIVTPTHNEEYLTILLNSKVLQDKYLEGIRSYNLDRVCSYLNSLNIAEFTTDLLLDATLYDTDFKQDYQAGSEAFKLFLEELKASFKDSGNKLSTGLEYSIRKSKKVCMLQANVRTTKHYQSRPFIKFYDKELELLNHNKTIPFTRAYLQDQDFTDLKRTEFTVKNLKHFKALDLPFTLRGLFSTSQDKLKQVQYEFMSKNFNNPRSFMELDMGEINAQTQRFLNHLRFLLDHGMNPFHFVNNAIRDLPSSTASRDKKLYEDLYQKLLSEGGSEEQKAQHKEYTEAQTLLDSHFGGFSE